jgi:phi13 family phage major tail protein
MAKIGLKYPVYSPATETDTAISYGTGAVLGKAMTANIAVDANDVKLYADDGIAEIDKSFTGGTVTVGVDDMLTSSHAALLGATLGNVIEVATGEREIIAKTDDNPAYVGFGFYGKKIVNGVKKWRAVWLKKVQFSMPSDETATKGESVEFQTPTLEGDILRAADGEWKNEATFSTEALAKAWLNGKAGIVAKSAGVTSNVASGAYTTAKNVTLTTTEATGTIYYTDDGTIPSATNGTEYTEVIALAKPSNTCIKAVTVTSGKANSDIMEIYITIT